VLRVHIIASSLSVEAVLTTDVHVSEEIAIRSISTLDVYIYAKMSSLTVIVPFSPLTPTPNSWLYLLCTYL